MKWFKHFAENDLLMDDLQREHGDAGYAFWYRLCELYAVHGNDEGMLTISWPNLERRLHRKRAVVERLLDWCSSAGRLEVQKGEREVKISSPAFLEMRDNYTKYQKGRRRDFDEPLKKRTGEKIRADKTTTEAESVYAYYTQHVKGGARADAIKSITRLLKENTKQELFVFIDRYVKNGMPKDKQYRIQANNFFGKAARYQDYIEQSTAQRDQALDARFITPEGPGYL